MKIRNIKINSYGILKNKEINLENNLNIIYGKNESGKSTLLNYIKNIFYGISKNKNGKEISDYEKYTPWIGEEFSGKIKYELDNGENFEIYRDFNKKNAKIFNYNLEEISAQFKIDKKDGTQFFYDQTGVDEKTYISTVMSPQQELVLDKPSQNILVQKLANLAGTGDDKVSFQKAMDKLNKRQVEEVGTNRTQDRPLNVIQNRMKEVEVVLKDEIYYLNNKQNLEAEKDEFLLKLELEKQKNEKIKIINKFIQKNQINLEKNKLKIKIKNENEEKIKKLKEEKEKLLKNNFNNLQKNKNLENKKNNFENNKLNKKIKINYFIFLIIFILLIIMNIFNFKFISNKIINYFLLSLIPIELILFIISYFKNNKIRKKLIEKDEKEKIENQKLQESISSVDSQINLLISDVEKLEKEIQEEKEQLKEETKKILTELQSETYSFNDENILEKESTEKLQKELEKSEEQIVYYQLQLNRIEYEEKNISEKLEEIISLKEEYENLQEQLQIIQEKNKCIQATKDLLEKAYEKMKKNVTPKFTQNLSKLIEKITNGKYKKVSINEENGLIVELENGEYIPANLLSVGTIDQLYLSLRLSMINEISKEKMPIILDEIFAYSDEERLKNTILFLIDEAKEHQIILLTCTNREKQILDQLGISYNWVEI